MSRTEFKKLKVGDAVQFMHGPDAGAVFQVVFIEDYDNICLRAMYNCTFAPTCSNSHSHNKKLKVVTGSGIYVIR